ncbi:histone-lysine N-methyltransferase SETMAR [Elysia marginata]|uniref:Histone-lysine N-methyltransferase SETMAR n=1 Tax=Elysia marginata TaxID=1093978 RepID=A0AAV4GIQ5_9GAST|nr:histone-lysine N-methyltransferase SETMAR [Elysia marginata]
MCTQHLEHYIAEGEAVLERILNGHELLTTTIQNVRPNRWSIGTRKFKAVASARKALFTVFWDMGGVLYEEFLEQGQTVNSKRYISTFQAIKLRLRRVRRNKDSILQLYNTRPHTRRQTQDALRQLELTTLPHSAHSPGLAPSDY